MEWYVLTSVISLFICLSATIWHVLRFVQLGRPVDHAVPAGSIPPAVAYSFTGAMSPAKKESAFLHLPAYFAGLAFHIGTFLAVFLFLSVLLGLRPEGIAAYIISSSLFVSFCCGAILLGKRLLKPALRRLSNPDDYISNILVTLFQLISAITLIIRGTDVLYYISATMLCLYFPLGKLRHAIYFFMARYHLGLFFGRRGVWPPSDTVKL